MSRKIHSILTVRDYYPSVNNPSNSTWVYDQVRILRTCGIDSLVISPTPYIPRFLRKYGRLYLYPEHSTSIEKYHETNVLRPPYIKFPMKCLQSINGLQVSKLINRYGDSKSVQLIHAHFGKNGVHSLLLKSRMKVPLCTYFYGEDVGTGGHAIQLRKIYKDLIINGDLFLALSQDMKDDLVHIGFPEERTVVHHLGVDIHKFPMVERDNRGEIVFCSVGRFHDHKGGRDSLMAFIKLMTRFKNIQLRFVGDGPDIPRLQEICSKHNVGDKVRFINNFLAADPRGTVVNEMKNADIFLFTPYEYANGIKTGTPVVLMEAQAMGLPCISTNYAGIPEVLGFGRTGLLCDQRDIQQIADAMESLIVDKELRFHLGKLGRAHIENDFNLETQVTKLANIYEKLV